MLKSCPFCGDKTPAIIREEGKSSRSNARIVSFYVQCTHCAARGTTMSGIETMQGTFEEDENDLQAQAATYWNDARR